MSAAVIRSSSPSADRVRHLKTQTKRRQSVANFPEARIFFYASREPLCRDHVSTAHRPARLFAIQFSGIGGNSVFLARCLEPRPIHAIVIHGIDLSVRFSGVSGDWSSCFPLILYAHPKSFGRFGKGLDMSRQFARRGGFSAAAVSRRRRWRPEVVHRASCDSEISNSGRRPPCPTVSRREVPTETQPIEIAFYARTNPPANLNESAVDLCQSSGVLTQRPITLDRLIGAEPGVESEA